MLSPTGIYVFESKNYSGWIFGNEESRYWTQSLQNKQKYKFFNPIWQNKGHITALKNILEIDENDIYKSYIIFSERCELKKIQVDGKNIKIIKRNDLLKIIEEDINTSSTLIDVNKMIEIYKRLRKHSIYWGDEKQICKILETYENLAMASKILARFSIF